MDGSSGRLPGLGTAAATRGTGTPLYIEISQMSTDWFRKLTVGYGTLRWSCGVVSDGVLNVSAGGWSSLGAANSFSSANCPRF